MAAEPLFVPAYSQTNTMRRLIQCSLDHAWLVGAFVTVLVGIAISGIFRLQFDDSYTKVFQGNFERSEVYDEYRTKFGDADQQIILVVSAPDVLAAPTIVALYHLVIDCQQIEGIQAVSSLFSARDREAGGDYLLPLVERSQIDQGCSAELRAKIDAHPMLVGHLVSANHQSTLVVLDLAPSIQSITQIESISHQVRQANQACQARAPNVQIALAGMPIIRTQLVGSVQREQAKFGMIGAVLIVLITWLMFRNIKTTFVAFMPGLIAMLSTLGVLGWFGKPIDVISCVTPVLVLVIAMADSFHLVGGFLRSDRHSTKQETIVDVVFTIGPACFLTSLTTALGFAALVVAQDEVTREFGLSCAVGCVIAFFCVVTITPLLLLTTGMVPRGSITPVNRSANYWQRYTTWLARHAARHGRRWSVGIVLFCLFLTYQASGLDWDFRFTENLNPRLDVSQAMNRLDRDFQGSQEIVILVENQTGQFTRTNILRQLDQVHQQLDSLPLFASAVSLRHLLESMPGDNIAQQWKHLEKLPSEAWEYWIGAQAVVVRARVPNRSAKELIHSFQQLESKLQELEVQNKGWRYRLTGIQVLATFRSQQMLSDLARSLGLASFVIFALLTLYFRSLRLGLICIIVNTFPLLLTAAGMQLFQIPLQYTSVMVFTVCLGIAVDDTIHLLHQILLEIKHAPVSNATGASVPPLEAALRRSLHGVGGVLSQTTLLVLIGFGVGMISEFPPLRVFAILSCGCLAAAWISDMVLLPLLTPSLYSWARSSKH